MGCCQIAQKEPWPRGLYQDQPFPLCASVSPGVKGLSKVAFLALTQQFCHTTLAEEKGHRDHSVASWGLVWDYRIWPGLLRLEASAWHGYCLRAHVPGP